MVREHILAIAGVLIFVIMGVVPAPTVAAQETVTLDFAVGPLGLGARADGYVTRARMITCPHDGPPLEATVSAYHEFSHHYSYWNIVINDDIFGRGNTWFLACVYDGSKYAGGDSGFQVSFPAEGKTIVIYVPPVEADDELTVGFGTAGTLTVTAYA